MERMLKGIHGVRPNNRKVIRAPGPRTKYFERNLVLQLTILNKSTTDLKLYKSVINLKNRV